MPVIIEFSRCIGTYSSAKFEYIINSMQLPDDNPIDYKAKYNNYRITALEKVELSVTSIRQVQNYKQTVKELIQNDDMPLEERQILLRMHKEHFRNN